MAELESAERATQSLCALCLAVVEAKLYERGEDVWMRKTCPNHGTSDVLYWRDRRLFRDLSAAVGEYTWCTRFKCLEGDACDDCLAKTYNVMVDVTSRCNLSCPVCCTDANRSENREPSIDQILGRLPAVRRGFWGRLRRPNIVLFGGEPTLRKDLPDLIRGLVGRGYVPRLATNGTRMTDDAYLSSLWDAGLRWVVLQFDGFDEHTSEILRGARLQARKLEALDKMAARGFKIQLGTMMVKGVNTRYAGEIIRFVGRHPNLFWVSFYPHSAQSRHDLPVKDTSVSELLDEIEIQTGGRITRNDFVSTIRLLSWAYRLMGTPNLRQKVSTLPMILLFEGEEYFPLTRLMNPRFALRHAGSLLRLMRFLPRLLGYQEGPTPPFVKFLVVEKFHADESIDLEEASNCHMAFMTPRQYVPFDMYNVTRKRFGGLESARENMLRRIAV